LIHVYASARGAAAYRQTHVQSSSPLELVVLLYDGLLKHLIATRDAADRRDLIAKRDHLSRTFAILGELQSTLNMAEGGEIAASLDALYTYVTGRLSDFNVNGERSALDEVERLITPLRNAWAEIATPRPAVASR
jgi:flagellar secretion chaperone FliS